MSAKTAIHQIVDELSDEEADRILVYLRAVTENTAASAELPEGIRISDAERTLLENAQPFTLDDPLWSLIGIIDDDGPDDMSANHDKYLAEIYADLHREE